MNYSEAVSFYHSLERFGIKPGLERVAALCEKLGNPQKELKFIHVAGTNGKGSTSTMLAEILMASNLKTGLFISPYVIDFRERFQVNGQMISETDLIEITKHVKNAVEELQKEEIQPTEFEAVTAAAFLLFKQSNCDIVVLEVGLGGRFDSTNIIEKPLLSIITKISLDHTGILGTTIEEIAAEKCGIIKTNGTTISYPEQSDKAKKIIENYAYAENNKLIYAKTENVKITNSDLTGSETEIEGIKIKVPLMGGHMVKNASMAVAAAIELRKAGFNISTDSIQKGILNVKMPARMEYLEGSPPVLIDGGHNEDCAEALKKMLRENFDKSKIIAVISMMSDKDYEKYLQIISPQISEAVITTLNLSRALSAPELAKGAAKHMKIAGICNNPHEALQHALSKANEFDLILICGSFYLASELRKYLVKN